MRKPVTLALAAVLACGLFALPAAAASPARPLPDAVRQEVAATDYAGVRIRPMPVAVQCWSYRKYSFFETIDKVKALGIAYLQAYPGQPLGTELPNAAFDPSMTAQVRAAVKDRLGKAGLRVVAYGVTDLPTTEPEARVLFDFARDMGIPTIVCEPPDGTYDMLDRLVKEYDIRVAIHNHPSPSKYASPQTVLERVRCADPRIGACADTGHWMREGYTPLECLRYLKGHIVDLHLKDRTDFGKDGPNAVDVAWGAGKARLRDMLAEMTLQDYDGYLTMEYENEEKVLTPDPDIKASAEFVKASSSPGEGFEPILRRRSWGGYETDGWNHYGPGYFELDARTGVLKSQGGMGLLWYAPRTYKDFVLDFDYKCSKPETNSGVFIRVPAVPTSDDYIYHGFEVQIDDAGTGIHKTGAAYDAEAPTATPGKPAGEWNHMTITCAGKRLQVAINGTPVLDWTMAPRGKVRDFAAEGYIGFQNHDSTSPVYFRDIYVKDLSPAPAKGKKVK